MYSLVPNDNEVDFLNHISSRDKTPLNSISKVLVKTKDEEKE